MLDYDIRNGRTYLYFTGEPQYHFGYGLSYTSFELRDLQTSANALTLSDSIVVSVEVENTGERAGDEVVQLYVRHLESVERVERPDRALKGFARVSLEGGQKKRVEISLRGSDLAYWNVTRRAWDLETGSIALLAGTSSRQADLRLEKTLRISARG
jgi:beta-glucosidase